MKKMMNVTVDGNFKDLALLNRIKADPDVSQAALAEALKISIGSVNGRLRHMLNRGLIEVKRTRRRKLRYIITLEGLALHGIMMQDYLLQSFQLYRQVRQQVNALLKNLDVAGVNAVRLLGEGDVADVCKLTCCVNQISLTDDFAAPALVIDGLEIRIEWPEDDHRV
jgi:DNA-binding MarR family transcriptional regulator